MRFIILASFLLFNVSWSALHLDEIENLRDIYRSAQVFYEDTLEWSNASLKKLEGKEVSGESSPGNTSSEASKKKEQRI